MRISLLVACFCLVILSAPTASSSSALSDSEQIQNLLDRTRDDLNFLTNLTNLPGRKFAYEFVQDLKESKSHLSELTVQFEKLNVQSTKDSTELHQLLSPVTLLSNHVAAQREAVESDPKSTGTRTVAVTIWFGDKKVPGWRVGYIGENSVKAKENVSLLIDNLCANTESRNLYEVSTEAKAEVKITVVVGWVYLWVQPANRCAPKSEPLHAKNPTVADLYAPVEKQ